MKSILLVLAISFAFVAAQSPFVVSLIYTGDTECTDASKLIWVQVTVSLMPTAGNQLDVYINPPKILGLLRRRELHASGIQCL